MKNDSALKPILVTVQDPEKLRSAITQVQILYGQLCAEVTYLTSQMAQVDIYEALTDDEQKQYNESGINHEYNELQIRQRNDLLTHSLNSGEEKSNGTT